MRVSENRQAPAKLKQNGSAIRDFRRKAGMDRSELAERTRISYPHMANIENEHKDVSYEVLYRLAAALVVDIRSVLRDPPAPEDLDQLMYDEAREQAS
ncbi:helix-turn-helix domain-containing protein [Nonomuraea polychroma]|uniref:helix-turn-helix domain-containing protein n=1 Tax=Nonomuraea polychroma TaxID=46176 RepID=UPI003D8CE8E7